jgi:signal transduction histidine kinase
MKLFTKTFIFFISIIIIQSNLTFFIITNIIKKNNLQDAKKELTDEASFLYESFNSWKRSIWINLIALREDDRLKEILLRHDSFSSRNRLLSYIKERVLLHGIDCVLIKSTVYPHVELIPYDYSVFTISDLKDLSNIKSHPYIEMAFLGNVLHMVGTVRILSQQDFTVDVFIMKQIDQSFCLNLADERRSQVSFFIDNSYLVGAFGEESLLPPVDTQQMESAYKEFYDSGIGKSGYNISIQKLGNVSPLSEDTSLYLVTSLSNLPYQKRVILVKRIVLYVSILGAFLTAVLSLFLSRNISKPVKNLLHAMYRVKNGNYDTKIRMKSRSEIGELFRGFNEMALKLSQDKTQMENYIREIIMLKDYNEKIIHSIRAGIAIINRDLIIEKANSSFLHHFKLDEERAIGKKIHDAHIDIIDRDILQNVESLIRRKKQFYSKIKRSKDRRVYEIKLYPLAGTGELNDESAGCVFTVDDISEKVEFEEKIFQAEKLSSLSVLSAGVAHQINNPLSSIMSNVQNLIEEEEKKDKKVSLKWIEQETRRIARTVNELLNFSSSDTTADTGANVNEVIDQVINILKYSINKEKDISIKTEFENGLPRAVINEDELQHVIINLINNSIQAVEDSGTVTVRTFSIMNNHTINIVVEDDGKGIAEEHIPHIFDPFFTTKHNGEGTGLGLSVVYGIVRKYNGHIKVDSTVGQGTKISLAIPTL